MRTSGVSARNLEYLEAVVTLQDTTGWLPTVRDLAAHFSCTVSTAHGHLAKLKSAGLIEQRGFQMRVTDLGRSVFDVTRLAA